MKNLPKYWVVQLTEGNQELFRKTVIPYLLETYGEYWSGIGYEYYGFDGSKEFKGTNCHNNLKCFKNNPVLLTLDEFIKLPKKEETMKQGMYKEEFVLPEKWCIKVTEVNKPTLKKWLESKDDFDRDYISVGIKGLVLSNPCADHSYQFWASHIPLDYTEITFEQFKKYVLKGAVMEKQIIGYKLKKDCQQYLDAAEAIAANGSGVDFKIGDNLEYYLQKFKWGTYKERLEKVGVLDLWFEPVYEEVYKYTVGDWVVVLPEDPYYYNCEQGCAQQIADIDFNGNLPYRLKFSNKSIHNYSKIRLATPEEIKKATTKEFPIGKYTAVVKGGKIIINDKGRISVEAFNNFYEGWLQDALGTTVDDYNVSLTAATIKIGCVRDITLNQVEALYNYTKTL